MNAPKEIVKELRLKERQKVVVRASGSKIVIENWKKERKRPQAQI